jgi:dienelactone hydrolase
LLARDATLPGTIAIVALNPATMAKEIIFQHPEVDANAQIGLSWTQDTCSVFGFAYEADRARVFYVDPDAAQIQATLDQALPATVNEIVSASANHQVVAIEARSDRDPGKYYVFDRQAKRLLKIGSAYDDHDPTAMGAVRVFSFQSRDGLTIHGRLLLPPGNPAKPPVLLATHDGLTDRPSSNSFDAAQQIYATRGYAVAVIDYRGTEGYGPAFVKAGDYQFGTGMVDDLMAGLDYLVAQGWVAPDRIGLLTTGWGGGFVGVSTLARSDRFKVWINENTVLSRNGASVGNLACSPKNEKDVIADFGSRSAAVAYADTVEPKTKLSALTVPSFHLYYSTPDYSSVDDAFIATTKLKGPPDRLIIAKVHPPSMEKPAHAAEFAARERLFQFLQHWLPVDAAHPEAAVAGVVSK